jgi:hypothetical protein
MTVMRLLVVFASLEFGSLVQSSGSGWGHRTPGQGMTPLASLVSEIPATPYSTPWSISGEGGEWSSGVTSEVTAGLEFIRPLPPS